MKNQSGILVRDFLLKHETTEKESMIHDSHIYEKPKVSN